MKPEMLQRLKHLASQKTNGEKTYPDDIDYSSGSQDGAIVLARDILQSEGWICDGCRNDIYSGDIYWKLGQYYMCIECKDK
jgi:hypothetical protein